jgi:hypothetical protein
MKVCKTSIRPNQEPGLNTLQLDGPDSIRPGGIDHGDRAVDERGLPDPKRPGYHVDCVLILGCLIS